MDIDEVNYSRNEGNQQSCIFTKLLISFLILVILIALPVTVIIFVLRFKTPAFRLESIQLSSHFLADYYNSTNVFNHTCPVVSLVFSMQNPNVIGIRYSSSLLDVLYENNSIGMIEMPSFYQPSKSKNVTVFMHLLFEPSKVNRVVNEGIMAISGTENSRIDIRIVGGLKVRTRVWNLPLPKIQVSLDCLISTSYSDIMSKGAHHIEKTQALSLSSLPKIRQECSIKMHKTAKTVDDAQNIKQRCF